jgi:hypothetical protein
MRSAHLASCCLVAALLAGCGSGAPRVDTSSEANLKTSLEKIKGGMNDDERRQFASDTVALMMPDMEKNAAQNQSQPAAPNKSPSAPSQTEFFKSMNGMTAAEIHAKAEAIRQEAKAKKK